MNKKTKKIISFLSILSVIFLQTIPSFARAATDIKSLTGKTDVPSKQRLALEKTLSEADRKQKGPTVTISFTSDNFFKVGSKVTALALADGFSNPQKDLYYTWYLKHKNCELSDKWWKNFDDDTDNNINNDNAETEECDLDEDGIISPNDWKIAAARINVQGSFYSEDLREKEGYLELGAGIEEESGSKADPFVKDQDSEYGSGSGTSKDGIDYGWRKNFDREKGGDHDGELYKNNSKDAPNCSILHPVSGIFYELSNQDVVFKNTCPEGYSPSCIKDATATCSVLNPQFKTNPEPVWCQNPATADQQAARGCLYPKSTTNTYDYCYVSSQIDTTSLKDGDAISAAMGQKFSCSIEGNQDKNTEDGLLLKQGKLTCLDGGIAMCTKTGADTGMFEREQVTSLTKTEAQCMANDTGRGCLLGIIFKSGTTAEQVCAKEALKNTGESVDILDTLHLLPDPPPPITDPPYQSDPLDPGLDPGSDYFDKTEGTVFGFSDNLNDLFASVPATASIKVSEEEAKKDRTKCANLSNELIKGMTRIASNAGFSSDAFPLVDANPELEITETGCTFEKSANGNGCKHLFPFFPKKEINGINVSDDIAGDGKFTLDEKKFWWADPTVTSTNAQIGLPDEAVVIGKGVNKFIWTYSPEDEIGVIVEGESDIASDHLDASYKTMWAFSKGECPAIESVEGEDRGFYMENVDVGIFTTNFDLDRCLVDNLEAPSDGGATNIKANLTFFPDSPANDPNGVMGDILKVMPATENTSDLNNIYYEWKVELSDSKGAYPAENAKWEDITEKLTFGRFLSAADIKGLGKNELNLSLNIPTDIINVDKKDGVFYLRFWVTIEEKSGEGGRKTQAMAVIRIKQLGYDAKVYSVVADSGGILKLGEEFLCPDPKRNDGLCPVTKNKILGIKITDENLEGFTWTINNNPASCSSDISADCQDGVLIFPVLGNIGESVNVIAKAIKSANDTASVIKRFIISSPGIGIDYDTGVRPKLLGYYFDLDETKPPIEDFSGTVFETTFFGTPKEDVEYSESEEDGSDMESGGTVSFTAAANLIWETDAAFEWTIDGEIQKETTNVISFPIKKEIGDSYNINVTAKNDLGEVGSQARKSINNLRKALYEYWNISPEESVPASEDEEISYNFQLNVVENFSYSTADGTAEVTMIPKTKKIFASLVTNLPEQMLFLLKITLTAFSLMFFMSILFSFMPEAIFRRNDENL